MPSKQRRWFGWDLLQKISCTLGRRRTIKAIPLEHKKEYPKEYPEEYPKPVLLPITLGNSHIHSLPTAAAEIVAQYLTRGRDLVNWLSAFIHSKNLGDLRLILVLQRKFNLLDHKIWPHLNITQALDAGAKFLISKVSRFYSIVQFNGSLIIDYRNCNPRLCKFNRSPNNNHSCHASGKRVVTGRYRHSFSFVYSVFSYH